MALALKQKQKSYENPFLFNGLMNWLLSDGEGAAIYQVDFAGGSLNAGQKLSIGKNEPEERQSWKTEIKAAHPNRPLQILRFGLSGPCWPVLLLCSFWLRVVPGRRSKMPCALINTHPRPTPERGPFSKAGKTIFYPIITNIYSNFRISWVGLVIDFFILEYSPGYFGGRVYI